MANKNNQRRASGNMPLPYDVSTRPSTRVFPTHSSWYPKQRQQFTEHIMPGPTVPYNFYDRFGPEEPPVPPPPPPATGFREGFPNEFGPVPNFWIPSERDFFPGTASPERFRPPQPDGWQGPPAWKEPDVAPVPRPPRRGREGRTPKWKRPPPDTTATRMFEPSDNWKQTHGEPPQGRDHYSPSQPVTERYRPYSPPVNAPRNRFPLNNTRSDSYRQTFNDTDQWSPDENEPYESIARDHRASVASAHSTTPDLVDRRVRGFEADERSVTPVSPHSAQHSSPGYGSTVPAPKRESPELPHLLPHLEALSPKSGPPVSVPPAHKPHSRSPSYSSTSSSVNLPHIQAQQQFPKNGLPAKPQFQLPPRSQGSGGSLSSSLQASPMARASPELDISSISRDETPKSASHASSSRSSPTRPVQNQPSGANGTRHSLSYKAPAFVRSTLAIDAPLMVPTRVGSSEIAKGTKQPGKADDGFDMNLAAPPSPTKGVREDVGSDSIRSSRSPTCPTPDRGEGRGRPGIVFDKKDDSSDDSDMEMSPPASPMVKPTTPQASSTLGTSQVASSRPTLAIRTASSSPGLLPHEILRQTASASPVPTTPEHANDDDAGNDSDMEMSSPTSETTRTPSPLRRQSPASPALVVTSSEESPTSVPGLGLTTTTVATPKQAAIPAPELDSPIPPGPVPVPPISMPVSQTPSACPATPVITTSREVSVQVSPRIGKATALDRHPVNPGELSPPASEETLREETEGVEKDHDAPTLAEKETNTMQQQEASMLVDQPSDKIMTEIPLSDALRMVARLRFRHDPITQEARVEPILISNRHLAEPEAPETAASSPPESLVQTITEKEQRQLSEGGYDGTKHSLRKRFAQHQAALAEKVARLRKEYLALHERWVVHCAKMDEVARASALEEAAAAACRTTRRTTAMGDAVRSDLEMEQILASLGNEELTDANILSGKNAAVIPDMVSVTKGRVEYIYDDTNNLVEDPHEFYKLETGIDDWTEEEKKIMVEKYAVHPKQFAFIADYLPNKTPSQCVTFYYLHKNTTIDFRKAVAQYNTIGKRTRRGRGKQKGNALLADILKHDDEVGRDSTPSSSRRKRSAPSSSTPVPSSSSVDVVDSAKRGSSVSRRGTAQNTPDPTPDPEPSQKRPRRRANPSARAAAAMEQDNTEEGADEEVRPAKRTRKVRKSKAEVDDADDAPTTPADGKPADQPQPEASTSTSVPSVPKKRVPGSGSSWSAEDKALFLKLLAQYGDDFKRIASSMPNKTTIQVAAFYRANVTEMQLAKVAALAPKRSPTPHEPTYRHSVPNIPGAGIMTPVLKPMHLGVDNGAASSAVSRSRTSGRMSPPPNPSGTQSAEIDKRANSAAQRDMASFPKIVVPLQYQGGLAAAFAGPSRNVTAQGMGPPLPSTGSRPPPTLTMSFPSALAYSNLSPSNFSGDQRTNRAPMRQGLPSTPENPSMMMEFSEFAPPPPPQPWHISVPASMAAPGATVGPSGSVVMPTALETTDDLVRYLEHRTRLTAGQNNDSDFM